MLMTHDRHTLMPDVQFPRAIGARRRHVFEVEFQGCAHARAPYNRGRAKVMDAD